jgi:hypothetical protein
MSLHATTVTAKLGSALSSLDCWNLVPADIEKLAGLTGGNTLMSQLRHGTMSAIIVGTIYGGSAKRFSEEFRKLAHQCASIRADATWTELDAIAFFHLRFGFIHPLVDGNGRVGRLLLSEQIRRSFNVEIQATLDFLWASQKNYRAAFVPLAPQTTFERMLRLLASHTGVQIDQIRALPFPISPAYPDKRPLLDSMKSGDAARASGTTANPFRQRSIALELQRSAKKVR